MLTELYLGNFKAFAAPVRVPIRPLTLIFGPNSAGKSSLIHGLALGHEATRGSGRLDIRHTGLGGDAIDLGGFRQFVHRRALDQNVSLGVESQWAPPFFARKFGVKRFAMLASFGLPPDSQVRPLTRAKPTLAFYELKFDEERRLRMSRRSDGKLHVDELTPSLVHMLTEYRRFSGPPIPNQSQSLGKVDLQDSIANLIASSTGLFPVIIKAGASRDGLMSSLAMVFSSVRSNVRSELGRLSYLGPLRAYPPRHMAFAERDDTNWAAGGGRAWDRMRKSKKLRDAVNVWLGSKERLQTPYKLSRRRFVAPSTAKTAIIAGIDEILSKVHERDESAEDDEASPLDRWDRDAFVKVITQKLLHDHNVEGDDDLVLVDLRTKTTVSHRDVGIGISQVLPVLVEAYGNANRIVAIEQPEIHLHPRLQAELGDVFIESALGGRGNTFLLETHSEHLILRMLRRIRETAQGRLAEGLSPVRPEDVAVLFVVPDDTGSRIVEIPITAEGEFARPWPGGFFAERMKELY